MTKRLQQAFSEAAKLPQAEQDAVAEWLLAELESERAWQASLSGSHDKLAELGDEALAEHRAGKSKNLDPRHL